MRGVAMNGSLVRMRVARWGAALLLLLLATLASPAARAQGHYRYFPATGHYSRGAFCWFWESHVALYNFGFPITEEYIRKSDGRLVQYYERARFELAGV